MKSLQDSGSPFALLTVVKASSSTPRKQGARMIVEARGRATGTIGGGPVEKRATAAAEEMLFEGRASAFMEFSLDSLVKSPLDKFGEPSGSPSPDNLSHETVDTGSICGGSMSVFIQCYFPPAHLLIAGGGHIAKFLYKQAAGMDFGITIVDNREEFALENRFPKARVIHGNYGEIISSIPLNSPTYVIIITHGHKFDQVVLDKVLEREWDHISYVGMIGSSKKVKRVLENSLEKGADPAKVRRIRTPIGLDIGASTPSEIAVAILAEIISVRRGMDRKNFQIMSIADTII